MKLNADILFDGLAQEFETKIFGRRTTRLHLGRPELPSQIGAPLKADRLYLVRADKMPRRVDISQDALIVSIGTPARINYYETRCCVICVQAGVGYPDVFNALQRIYDRYDAWDEALRDILEDTGDIEHMLEASLDVFGRRAMTVVDENYRYAAVTGVGTDEEMWDRQRGREPIDLESLRRFTEENKVSLYDETPRVIKFGEKSRTLYFNIVDNGSFKGSLNLSDPEGRFRPSDSALGLHLAKMLLRALRRRDLLGGGPGSIRSILHDLALGTPLDRSELSEIAAASANSRFVCVRIQLSGELAGEVSTVPVGYSIGLVGNMFKRSWAFPYEGNAVVAYIDISQLGEADAAAAQLKASLSQLAEVLDARIGVSDAFEGLSDGALYLTEATSALENGLLLHPKERYFEFHNLALFEMLSGASSTLPVRCLSTPGLKALAAHDQNSNINYSETLRVFLRNNMSIAATARELYVHRSTLVARLERMREILGDELERPEDVLRMWMVLEAEQFQAAMTQ